MKKVNFGCGEYLKDGYLNVDNHFNADLMHDLNVFPYPISSDSYDLIEMHHVLEHLLSPFDVMKELKRIATNKGIISIRVPHFSRGFTHPDHKRGFDVTFPFYFDETKKQFFGSGGEISLKLVSMKLEWYAQPYLKKEILHPLIHVPLYFTAKVINFFANLSPALCSRIWCFWVGGFEEIEFIFKVEKV